jgi:hypothetical protein
MSLRNGTALDGSVLSALKTAALGFGINAHARWLSRHGVAMENLSKQGSFNKELAGRVRAKDERTTVKSTAIKP